MSLSKSEENLLKRIHAARGSGAYIPREKSEYEEIVEYASSGATLPSSGEGPVLESDEDLEVVQEGVRKARSEEEVNEMREIAERLGHTFITSYSSPITITARQSDRGNEVCLQREASYLIVDRKTHRAVVDETGERRIEKKTLPPKCKLFLSPVVKCVLAQKDAPDKCGLVKQAYACVGAETVTPSHIAGLTGTFNVGQALECTKKLQNEGLVNRTGEYLLGDGLYYMPATVQQVVLKKVESGATVKIGEREFVRRMDGSLILKK